MNKRLSDLQAFYEALRPIKVTQDGAYTPKDRFRDFRAVFFGSAQAQRVLAQILDECEGLPVTLNQLDSHSYLAHRHGKREVGLRIVQWMNAVPPDVTVMKEDDDG